MNESRPQTRGSAERDTQSRSPHTRYICSDTPLSWPFPQFFRTTKDELLYSTRRSVLTFTNPQPACMMLHICHGLPFPQPQVFSSSDMPVTLEITHFVHRRRGLESAIMIWMHDLFSKAKIQLFSWGPTYGCFQLKASKAAGRIPKACSIDATWFQCAVPVVSFYIWSARGGSGGEDTHGFATPKVEESEGDERGEQTSASPKTVQHKSLFVLDPCSTPSTPTLYTHHPAAVIKHGFISLHPLVQFGHIIPCLSRGNLHKRPQHTHIWFTVCADTRGDPRRRGEICSAIKTYSSDISTCGFWHISLWFSGQQLWWDR